MQKYIIEDGYITGVEGEKLITERTFQYNFYEYRVMITNDGEYHNFYIITDKFQREPLNNLDVQEPTEVIKSMSEDDLFRFMEERAISFYLWDKYNRSYCVKSEEI